MCKPKYRWNAIRRGHIRGFYWQCNSQSMILTAFIAKIWFISQIYRQLVVFVASCLYVRLITYIVYVLQLSIRMMNKFAGLIKIRMFEKLLPSKLYLNQQKILILRSERNEPQQEKALIHWNWIFIVVSSYVYSLIFWNMTTYSSSFSRLSQLVPPPSSPIRLHWLPVLVYPDAAVAINVFRWTGIAFCTCIVRAIRGRRDDLSWRHHFACVSLLLFTIHLLLLSSVSSGVLCIQKELETLQPRHNNVNWLEGAGHGGWTEPNSSSEGGEERDDPSSQSSVGRRRWRRKRGTRLIMMMG